MATVSVVPASDNGGVRAIYVDGVLWGKATYVPGARQFEPAPQGKKDERGKHLWEVSNNEQQIVGRVRALGDVASVVA